MTTAIHDHVQDPLIDALCAAQARHQLFPSVPGGCIASVVAVSGGADSVCLLHALHSLAPAWGLALHVAHVDHGLRPDAAADAAFVARLASDLGLAYHSTRLDPEMLRQQPGGIEAAARDARYAWLGDIACQVTPVGQQPLVVVGHHADDQAETVLLHLVQGTGVDGLAGMRWSTVLPGATGEQARRVQVVRPLLALRRTDVAAYLGRHGLAWRTDATNDQVDFLRNRIRHQVLPLLSTLNPQVTVALGRTAALMADAAARLDALDADTLAALATETVTAERVVLDWTAWARLSGADQRAILHVALGKLGVDQRQLGFTQVDTLARRAAASSHATGPHPLAGGAAWTIVGKRDGLPMRLCLHKADALPLAPRHPYLDARWRAEVGVLPLVNQGLWNAGAWQLTACLLSRSMVPTHWQTNQEPWSAYLAADCVGQPMLTTPQRGYRIAPLGMNGRSKALGDLFTAAKVPASLRSGWPLIVDGGSQRVLWACGLCVSHAARITMATSQVLLLQWTALATGAPGTEG